uniref:Uncharacterized protein n=1 Tax=Romanomermis culicivorax TaxID=13658 RepID=A0A915I2S0_ROMCU
MGCEKLRQFSTTTTTPPPPAANFYDNLCTNLYKASFDVLAKNLPVVLASSSFLEMGKGYALNMPLVEDVLPNVIHLLSPEMGCQTLIKLYEILQNLASDNSPSSNGDEYNEKFVSFLKRLYEMCDTHLIHKASEVVECPTWPLLNQQMRERIKEIGIFVDMKKPSAPPPKLSSLNRSYKRSSSSATTTPASKNSIFEKSRDRSLSQRKFKKQEKTTTTLDGESVEEKILTSASVVSTPKNDSVDVEFVREEEKVGFL